MSLYTGPDGPERLGDVLERELAAQWTHLMFSVAYARMSGIDYVYDLLESFAMRPDHTLTGVVGIDQHGTSYEAIAALLEIFSANDHQLFVCHNPRSRMASASPTFHPKAWIFSDTVEAKLLIGSGNLTQGGLYTNYEIGTCQVLRLHDPSERLLFRSATGMLSRWSNPSFGDVRQLDQQLLHALWSENLVLSEDELRRTNRYSIRAKLIGRKVSGAESIGGTLFPGEDYRSAPVSLRRAPRHLPPSVSAEDEGPPDAPAVGSMPARAPSVIPLHRAFCIHISPREKTELYLAQTPLREDPAFFGLPFTGRTEPRQAGNPSQPQAEPWPVSDVTVYGATDILIQKQEVLTKMWHYLEGPHANRDVRIYLGADVQREVVEGSVCLIERQPRRGIDYSISFFAPGHPDFAWYDSVCAKSLPNSNRRYGWL